MIYDVEKIANQHKFCFKCGGELEYKGKNLLICKKCGYHNYINPCPCSGAILENEKGEILLVVRKVDPMKGFLDVPGGFIDLHEDAEEGMTRELKEELGIDVSNVKYFASYVDTYEYDGVELPTLGIIFTANIVDQKISIHDDISGYEFFNKDELPFEKLAFDGIRNAINEYVEASMG